MIIKVVLAFLLFDCMLACIIWLLLADDFETLDHRMTQAEKERDYALDEWFQAQDNS